MRSRIGLLRVAAQRIAGSTFASPLDAARHMLAMQGQDWASLKWSIGLRVPKTTDARVEEAFTNGKLVRAWPMRGTLHAVAAEDLPWMVDLCCPRVVKSVSARRAALSLDEKTLERARTVAENALGGGKHLTREELQALWDRKGISTAGQRGYHMLFHLSITKTLCFGPPKGKQQTFVLMREWIKKPRTLGREEALGELARRYFQSHGPATLADFAGWTKLTLADTKVGIALAGNALTTLDEDGVRYVMAADAEDRLSELQDASTRNALSLHALPGFDEFVLGYKERGAVIDRAHMSRIVPGGNGVFKPTIVKDGRVVGTWRRVHKAKNTIVEAEPFSKLGADAARAFAEAAASYGRFLGVTVAHALFSS